MSVSEVIQSYETVKQYAAVRKAIKFKGAYINETGHRPSLVSVIALYQDYKARAEKAEAALQEIVDHSAAMDNADDPQPPNGDDYNEVLAIAQHALKD
jgi:hypothetical protein